MEVRLEKVTEKEMIPYKREMQVAFQKGFEAVYGKTAETILPEADIDQSLQAAGAAAYKAVVDGAMLGGAVVVIDEKTQRNHLDLLYVKDGVQTKGIGFAIWKELERLYPDTTVWETCTPCFEKRNIHFYVEKCGFQIVEFQGEETLPEGFISDGGEGMFVFRKWM